MTRPFAEPSCAVPRLNLDVSNLEINDETIALIINSIALECHAFALSRGIPSGSADLQLNLVFEIFVDYSHHLIDSRVVPTGGTSCIAAITLVLSNEGYGLIAQAAKDRVAYAANGDANA